MSIKRIIKKIEADMKQVGWSVIAVDGDPALGMPWWAYTIGMSRTLHHPELVIAGLAPETMQRILNNVGALVRNGTAFTDGARTEEVVQNYAVAFRKVHHSWYADLFGSARRVYGDWDFQMLHIVYPDAAGRFPWDAGCDAVIRERQPRLDLPQPQPGTTPSA